jgi:ABC-2 type transport system ATP-binding protein
VDGIDILAHPAAARRHIGYLPDIAGLYENLTVREYLDFYAALQGIPARLRRQSTDELVELIGLTAERDRAVRALSRGMRQQLGVARCLIHDPSVLLLDEPAAGMDPRARLDLRDILQELARLGKTILISSHMLSELAEVCTHLGFMRAGELLAEGETEEMVSAALPEARLRVRLLDIRGRDAARAVLEAHGASRDVEAVGDLELHAWFSGTHGDLAALLEEIRAGGVPVTEFALEEPELDDVYLLLSGSGAQT